MVLNIIGWSFVAAVTACGVTVFWAKLALAQVRSALENDIRYWHAEAVKARELAAQFKHENAIWSRGCQQGREDVIAIMPLLVATQDRLAATTLVETTQA